jgi:Flp pilus assembly protein TadD
MSKSRKPSGRSGKAGALSLDPGPLLHQAIARIQSRDPNAAVRICRGLIRDNPGLFDAHHILGFALAAKGDFHAALGAYDVALPLQPRNAELLNNMGIASGQIGALVQAIGYYDQALAIRPDYADALMNRGVALSRQGRWEQAVSSLQRAAQARPDHADTTAHLGVALHMLGLNDEAERVLRDGAQRHPAHADLCANLAGVLLIVGRKNEAVEMATRVLASHPDHVIARANRAAAHLELRQLEAAVQDAERALRSEPLHQKAWSTLVRSLEELGRFDEAQEHVARFQQAFPDDAEVALRAGSVLARREQPELAIPLLRKAVAARPDNAEALAILGTALIKTRDLVGAINALTAAAKLAPDNASIRNNLAVVSLLQQDTARAILMLRRALRADPDNPDLLTNLAFSYMRWGRFAKAKAYLQRSRSIAPDHPDVRWNDSLLRLLHGDFESGWDLYEARRDKDFWRPRTLSGPEATGLDAIRGKRLFLYAEQGLGDTIQFARYAELLAGHAGSVELEVQPQLVELLAGLQGVRVIGFGSPLSDYDMHLPLMSAPRIMGTRLDTIPAGVSSVSADPVRVSKWAQHLGDHGFRIGISWQGNPHGSVDQGRSFPVRLFNEISGLEGVRLISLQKNSGLEQLAALPAGMTIETLGDGFDAGDQAFLDTAAVMMNLDLIITSDTSVAHVAGTLGRPVWIALKYAPDWRWLLQRTDSPWYSSARLFRQSKYGDWQGVFAAMTSALGELLAKHPGRASPPRQSPGLAPVSAPIPAAEKEALDAMQQGRFEQVVELCEQARCAGPVSGLVHYMAAYAYAQLGRHLEALERYADAGRLIPRIDVLSNWALSLNVVGRYADGLKVANDALTANPGHPVALINRVQSLVGLERFEDAVATARLVVDRDPSAAPGWINLAAALNGLKQHFDALEAADRALAIDPGQPAALDNRAVALAGIDRHDAALEIWETLLAADPGNASFIRASGLSLIALGRTHDALARLEQARQVAGDNPQVLLALACANLALKRYEDAVALCETLQATNIHDWQMWSVYGQALLQCGRADEAQAALQAALELRPDDLEVTRNLAHVCLLRADFQRGWDLYEGRRKQEPVRTLAGSELMNRRDAVRRRLFMYAEQGLGDTIQFARFAQVLARDAGSVELEVQPELVALLSGLRGVRVIGAGVAPSDYDAHVPLMSVPRILATRLESIPAEGPYITADPVRLAQWATRIGANGFKIGVAWQGNPLSMADEGRSMPVALFEDIARIAGVRLISLQKNAGVEQLLDLPAGLTIETLGEDFDAGDQAFLDAAAVVAQLDLVITCDTAIAHLAGAMGRPVWVALKHAPDWRWLLNRDDSPWYPTARLFRQPNPGDWPSVFKTLAQAVAAEVTRSRPRR